MSFDPHFSQVVLSLHFDGSNGATTFTDSSTYARAINGGSPSAKISTAQSKFGGSSMLNDGNGGLTTPIASELEIAAGQDFTLELWAFLTGNFSQSGTLLGLDNSNNGPFNLRLNTTLHVVFEGRDSGGTSVGTITSAGALSIGAWHFITLQRSGNTYTMYIDGVAETPLVTATALKASASVFNVSGDGNLGAYVNIYVDDIRYTNGTARYTSNFTSPTEAFPDTGTPPISFMAAYTDPNGVWFPLELAICMHSIRTIPGYNKHQLREEAQAAAALGQTWVKRDPETKQYYMRRPRNG